MTANPAVKMNYALESMRGLCAIFIVLLHDGFGNFLSDNAFINNSHVAVDFFFVLSGYVIALNYNHRIHNWVAVKHFMVRRLLRIYPLHLFVLMMFVVIECLKYFAENRFGLVANIPAFTSSNFENFIVHLVMLQGVFFDPQAFNPPSWSVSVEYITYAAFALAVLTRHTGLMIFLAMIASMAYITVLHDGLLEDGASYQLIRCIWSFAIGYFVFRIKSTAIRLGSCSQATIFVFCILGVIYASGERYELFISLLFGLMVLSLVNQELVISKILQARPFILIGTISYSIYMVHSMVYWFTSQLFRFLVPALGLESTHQPINLAFTILSLGLTIVTAFYTYQFIEMRFYKTGAAQAAQLKPHGNKVARV